MIKQKSQLLLAVVWLFTIVILLILAAEKNAKFSSSIFALLPESDQSALIRQSSKQISNDFSRRLILMLSGPDETVVRDAIEKLARELSAMTDVAEVFWRVEKEKAIRARNELFPYRFAVLDSKARQKLQKAEYGEVSEQALGRIYSLLSIGQSAILDDPFGLYSLSGSTSAPNLNFEVSKSLLKVTGVDQPTYLVVLELVDEPYDLAVQDRVLGTIEDVTAGSDITIERSGMLLHAAAGARQASTEISTIGLGSLIGIAMLILFVFRRITTLGLLLIPVSVGYISAVAISILVFREVHLVTLAFGAGLIGVSIDYALHFLCERRVLTNSQILPRILPGLTLGLFSSVMAYGAQALAPFPGLRQMAVFSVSGLIAAWLTVVLWFPWLTRKQTIQALPLAEKFNALCRRLPALRFNRFSLVMSILLLVIVAILLASVTGIDDVRLLQTSPKSLVAEEQKVRATLGIKSSSQYLLVKSNTLENSLQKEERIIPLLEALKQEGLVADFQAISNVLPSLSRQEENLKMVSALYDSQLINLYAKLNLTDAKRDESLTSFDREKNRRLTPERFQQLEISNQWVNLIVPPEQGEVATILRFSGLNEGEGSAALLSLSDSDPDLIFVDQTRNITALLGKYRLEIINWIAMAYLVVFVVLVFRYRNRVWRIVLPPAAASILTLVLLVQFEQGINLFHLMALILVLGIGLDMGIFLAETDGSSHTWMAVSMSCVTSLLAFGLLTLSKTPILHHFGITVLCGLGLVWIFELILLDRGRNEVGI